MNYNHKTHCNHASEFALAIEYLSNSSLLYRILAHAVENVRFSPLLVIKKQLRTLHHLVVNALPDGSVSLLVKEAHKQIASKTFISFNSDADTSICIQTSAEDRLFEKRARSKKFFSCPHAMLRKRATFVMWSRAELCR